MEAQFYGANCVRLSTKKANVVIDDTLEELGQKPVSRAGDLVLYTTTHGEPKAEVKIVIDSAGEYEVSDISIQGIPARAHIDDPGQMTSTMYRILIDDLRVGVIGHIYPELHNEQLEALGTLDVLFIPVGGNGYTLDGLGALKVIKKIEPKLVVPTHYADEKLNYPVPQQDLESALKNMAMEPSETVQKLKVKPEMLTDVTKLIVLERQ